MKGKAAVTGAFSYSGSYIARALLAKGWEVKTLTRRPEREHELQDQVRAYPLDFSNADELTRNLEGIETFVNTYWVRFNHPGSSFGDAIVNSEILVRAAERAGVKRIVHLSVSNPDINSSLPYYSGKAEVEAMIRSSELSYAILQPTLIFGEEELLVNNIAWLLRRLHAFVIPGDGRYRLQPIYVGDLAEIAAEQAGETSNAVIPAGGPDVLSFEELIHFLAEVMGVRVAFLKAVPSVALGLSKTLSLLLQDVLLTKDELDGLMEERLYVGDNAVGKTGFRGWAKANAHLLGANYTNELKRHHQKS
jgi:NADH dehydrogenase